MEDHFMDSASSHYSFKHSLTDRDSSRHTPLLHHHGNNRTMGGGGYGCGDQSAVVTTARKLQEDCENLREKVQSCDKGLGHIYQAILNSGKQQRSHNGKNLLRSASLTYQFGANFTSPSQNLDEYHVSDMGTELDNVSNSVPQVTVSEVQSAVDKLLSERTQLVSEVDDLKQITEAAKRERVLAIDEKDQLLRETHKLRVSVEASRSKELEHEGERSALREQVKTLQDQLSSVKRDNEQAKQLRTRALEERSKILEECTGLREELDRLQAERVGLYEETLHLQQHVEDTSREKRRLEHELDWLSQKSLGLREEAAVETRSHREQEETLAGKVQEMMAVRLVRERQEQPWGFTVEGGKGSQFYHRDPSIVVMGVTSHTPADSVLRFGDRILSFGQHNFRNTTRKEAVEKIRSCDLTSISMEIGRASRSTKPTIKELKIPGRRDFGFSYETRLFVTSTDEDGVAMDYLLPGDEIVQVQGKSAFNLKSSALKQLLKSSKDGLSLTIQRPADLSYTCTPTLAMPHPHPSGSQSGVHANPRASHLQAVVATSNPENVPILLHPGARCNGEPMQSPSTPKSNLSENSVGYHSLSHSVPSDISNGITNLGHPDLTVTGVGMAPDSTGQRGQTQSLTIPDKEVLARHRHSDGSVFTSPQPVRSYTLSGSVTPSGGSKAGGNYRSRPADFYSPRRNTTNSYNNTRAGLGLRPRPLSNSMPRSSVSPNIGSRMDGSGQALHFSYPQKALSGSMARATRTTRPVTYATSDFAAKEDCSHKPFSFSADNLDSDEVAPEISSVLPPKSQTPNHSRSREAVEQGGALSLPARYSRGRDVLSRSMGNMQTHV